MEFENIIFQKLYEKSISNSEKIAVCDVEKSLTYNELYNQILKCRTALWAKSYYKSDIVILKMSNCVDWVINFLSLLSIGCIVVPVSPQITDNEMDKLRVILDSQYERYYVLNEAVDVSKITIVNRLNDIPEDDVPAILHMTSGSTGNPKLCVRTQKNLWIEGVSYTKTLKLTEMDVIVNPLPLYHSYALGYACMGTVAAGCTLVLMDNYAPRKLIKCIEKYHATIALAVPAIIKELEHLYLDRRYETDSLRYIMTGAGALNEEITKKVEEKYNTKIYTNYGSTETGGLVSGMDTRKPFSVGKPMHGVGIQIRDANGKQLNIGEKGYIYIKSGAAMSGYYAEDTQIYDENDFLFMGDIGYLDVENNLFITGREKFFINVSGKKVNSKEIEEIILMIDGVGEVFVHPGYREDGTEIVEAEIVNKKEITKKYIRHYCKEYLSDYKIPANIIFKKAIKKNELGKHMINYD